MMHICRYDVFKLAEVELVDFSPASFYINCCLFPFEITKYIINMFIT